MDFITALDRRLRENASPELAGPMQAYMKNNFPFLGIKNEARKALLKPLWKQYDAEVKRDFRDIAFKLFGKPEREFHYCAMEILAKEVKSRYEIDDIELIETLITTKSWWDSVDFLAKHVLGGYLQAFPDEVAVTAGRFSDGENMWLNRSSILFQLGYKQQTDAGLLFSLCAKHRQNKEFFIQKAIGWALREFAKTDPEAVRSFVSTTHLAALSKREALKNL